jgi:Transposase DDE domain
MPNTVIISRNRAIGLRTGRNIAALRRRGSLTVWFTDEAIAAWRAEPRTTPGGQPHYSTLAIMTALSVRAVFGLALRQTEEAMGRAARVWHHCR